MKKKTVLLGFFLPVIMLITGCPGPTQTPSPSTQIILLGESFASGPEAVQEANKRIANATSSGCKAISVGGYGASGERLIIGVPVLLECPLGTQLLPDGTAAP